MKDVSLNVPLTAVATFVSYLLGTVNELVIVLMFFMLIDLLTGVMRSFITKTANSTVCLKGIFKKVMMLFVIWVSAGIEFTLVHIGMETNKLITVMVTCFFIVNEGISILENAGQMGLPIPKVLKNALEKLNEYSGGNDEKETKN